MAAEWYAILWTDNAGTARVRLFEGTAEQARTARALLERKYADGDGFLNDRIVVGHAPATLDDIRTEVEGD
jgi:hypothetical protein